MSKTTWICVVLIIFCIITGTYWTQTISTAEKLHHQAFLCSTLQREKGHLNSAELLNVFKFLFNNSTPAYAYKKPKFNESYAHTLIQNYLNLSKAQQQIAQNNFEQCQSIIQPL